eukprot:6491896-Amphidinium_carterae.1
MGKVQVLAKIWQTPLFQWCEYVPFPKVLDFLSLGSTLALRSYARLGAALSVLDYSAMGSSMSLRGEVTCSSTGTSRKKLRLPNIICKLQLLAWMQVQWWRLRLDMPQQMALLEFWKLLGESFPLTICNLPLPFLRLRILKAIPMVVSSKLGWGRSV